MTEKKIGKQEIFFTKIYYVIHSFIENPVKGFSLRDPKDNILIADKLPNLLLDYKEGVEEFKMLFDIENSRNLFKDRVYVLKMQVSIVLLLNFDIIGILDNKVDIEDKINRF
jgi:hypothetical protein